MNNKYMLEKNLKKNVVRDTLALGGITFYFIVIGRALVGGYMGFVWQVLIAAIILFIFSVIFRKLNLDYHVARALILVIFTALFYYEKVYSLFAGILFIAIFSCSLYYWKDWKKTLYGIVLGALVSLISYYSVIWAGFS